MRVPQWLLFVCLTVVVAASLRLPRLSLRPMHTDEAVHAAKIGALLESGYYRYDPYEYHGPTLNGATLLIAWLRGQSSYQDLDETTLRLVPALFGIGLTLLPLLFYDGLGPRVTILSMLFTAVSPAFVFYSRYYIQEILLVFFTTALLGCLWRYLQSRRVYWMVLAGFNVGLMHATKETCIIAWGAVVLSAGLVIWIERPVWRHRLVTKHLVQGLGAAVGMSVLLFSWFFTHPQGVWDSWATYAVYLNRAGHGSAHIHPWTYYLDLLTWIEGLEWPGWNEDYLVVLAVVGIFYALFQKQWSGGHLVLVRFLALYTFLMTVIYSALPYKTPWSMLGALHGMILLASLATDRLLCAATPGWENRLLLVMVLLWGGVSPLSQSLLQNFKYEADQTNPYVYAHTHRDIFVVCDTLRRYANLNVLPKPVVQVVGPEGDYWPLPWYLRDLDNIGYPTSLEAMKPMGDVVVTLPSLEAALQHHVYEQGAPGTRELYVSIFEPTPQFRHGVELLAYARMSLWEAVQQSATEEAEVINGFP